MTAVLQLSGYDTIGVDLDPDRVAALIRQFSLDVHRCDIEREPLPFADESFACALLCETFEHLRIDPAFVLSEIHNACCCPAHRCLLGRSVADPVQEFGKLRRLGHMGLVRKYSAGEVSRFRAASGFALQSVDYHASDMSRSWKRRLLGLAYRVGPRWLRRDVVIVARWLEAGPRLLPMVPLALPAPPS